MKKLLTAGAGIKAILFALLLLSGPWARSQSKNAPDLRSILLEQFRDTWVDQDWFVPVMNYWTG
jgi:hypothetical protein